MKKKFNLALIIIVVLNICLLSGCTIWKKIKYNFVTVLNGDNVFLYEDSAIQVIDGKMINWPITESAAWEVELPEDGFYSFYLDYSFNLNEKCNSLIYVYDENGEEFCCLHYYDFIYTDSWDKFYEDIPVSATIPAGRYQIVISPNYDDSYQNERFMDLKRLTICGTFNTSDDEW